MYGSLRDLELKEKETGTPFWKLVQQADLEELHISEESSFDMMRKNYQAMQRSDREYSQERRSGSGLAGGDAGKIHERREEKKTLCGPFMADVMERALKIAESNACMCTIVAAPTAGSCGVVPAVLLSVQDKYSLPDEVMIRALYTAGGIGGVIACRAFLDGAEGGCQAEIGSAAAMAAGAAVYAVRSAEQAEGEVLAAEEVVHAAAIALKGMLGLSCDPVAGLVEVPCVKRNVSGAFQAVAAADMALSGIRSRIPPDEVIDAMRAIGRRMDEGIRETGKGGLAATPTGIRIRESLAGHVKS